MEPMLRFKADDGSEFPKWEEKTLGEEGQFYGGLSGKDKEDFDCGNGRFVTYMNVYKNTFASKDAIGRVKIGDAEKQNKVRYGDILFTQSSETVDEVGLSSVYLYDDEPYLNSFCMGYRFNNLDNVCPEFIGYCMRSNEIRKSIMLMGQGISRINLGAKRLATVKYKIPSLPEQRKIADCLSAVDAVIAAQQAEVNAWKQRKKGVMQKLFSQEVRFKADDGSEFPAWEEKTLGDLGRLRNGYVFKSDSYVPHGKYRVITIANVQGERYVTELERANTVNQIPDNIASWQILKKFDILISLTGNIGRVSLNTGCDNLLNQRVGLFEVFSPISDRQWVFQRLSANDFRNAMEGAGQGAAQKNISRGDVESFPLSVPSLPEQRKIADCLASMDEVIQKAKDELAKWQELKKGLLQQMFV